MADHAAEGIDVALLDADPNRGAQRWTTLIAETGRTTRKVIITRALAKAGYHVPAHDLEDRTPRKRRDRRAA
jgi:hypothetical protein